MNEKFKVVNNYDYLTKDFIAEGQNGICYKYNDQVFKKFKNKPMFLFFLKALSNINSNSLILPQEFIYLNEYNSKNILGYLMKYVDGSKLNNLPDLINIKELFNNIDLLEKEIKELTIEYGLLLKDVHIDNIIYTNNNEIKIIDNDNDVLNPNDEAYDNYRYNMKELGLTLLPAFITNKNISNNISKLYDECIINAKAKPSIVLNESILELEKFTGNNINTLHDYNESMKLIRK